MRKISALSLAITIVMGVGLASAQTSTSTQKTVTTPLGSVDSTTTTNTNHDGPMDSKTVEKKKSTTEHPDGSVTTDHSKTVTKSD
jgi:hypothetical protein